MNTYGMVERVVIMLFQARSGGSVVAFATAKQEYDALSENEAALVWPKCLEHLANRPPQIPPQSSMLPSDWYRVCAKQLKWLFRQLLPGPQPIMAVLQGGGGEYRGASRS